MKTENALLGLINMHPDITGYQLKSIIDTSSGHLVRLHLSRIYPALRKMTEQGLLTYRSVPLEGRLDQKFYTLTPKGRDALRDWLSQPFPFTQARSCFDDYLLELSAMTWMGSERVCSYIDEGIAWLKESLDYQSSSLESVDTAFIDSGDAGQDDAYLAMWKSQRDFMIAETRSRIAWLESLREQYARAGSEKSEKTAENRVCENRKVSL